jgi:recombination protein RecA
MAKAPTKKQPSVDEGTAQRKALMESTRAFIEKATGQKSLGVNNGTWPYIPSGALTVDNLIGGTPLADGSGLVCPGFPMGRIVEIFGAESSGKTTLALSAIVQIQKSGGTAMFLDFENALHHGYAKAVGVDFDPDKLIYYAPSTFEEGLKMIYIAIKNGVNLIVVDSVAAMVPMSELERPFDKAATIGALARVMSANLPKMTQWLKGDSKDPKESRVPRTSVIFINQVRALIQTGGHGPGDDNTAGGKAVKFYCSVRLKLTRIRSDFVERADPVTFRKKKFSYGNVVQVKAVKNKMDGKQGHTGEIFIRYGSGVDEYLSVIEGAIPRKIVNKKGSSYEYGGETFRGKDRLRTYLMQNPKAFDSIRDKISLALQSEAPKVVEGEVEDEDILSDMRQDIGDDDVMDSGDDPIVEEEIVDDGMSS